MAWMNELKRAQQELADRAADPLRAKVESYMRGQTAMSTAALLDLLGLAATTANGRLLAKTTRARVRPAEISPAVARRPYGHGYPRLDASFHTTR